MDGEELGRLLLRACTFAGDLLGTKVDRAVSGDRDGQYAFDLVVDRPVVDMLTAAGLGVLSEESAGTNLERPLVAFLDPIDGSTNAAHGIPWFATSICVVDAEGPLQSIVMNHAVGTTFEARRGRGATRDGVRLERPPEPPIGEAIVGINGTPPPNAPWAQFRALGAAALDLCAVANGSLAGYVDFDVDAHGSWDYLGGLLVCREVGVGVEDAFGRDLVTADHFARRTPVAAASASLHERLLELRTSAR